MLDRFLPALALLGPLPGQSVLHVGPGGFAEIRDAIAAAAPHDVVEVAAGNYLPFTLDKPLTITALPAPPGQLVQVLGSSALSLSTTEFRPPAGTRAFVTNLHFRNMWLSLWPHATKVTRGTVCFEECTFEGANDAPEPGLRVQVAEVQLRRCLLLGGRGNWSLSPALTATNGSVFAVDCYLQGGSLGIEPSSPAGNGIEAMNCDLHLVRTDVVAGDSNAIACWSNWAGGHGVILQGNGSAWFADSTVRGGDGSCRAGGDALRNLGNVPVQLARTTLSGGTGTPPGAARVGPTTPAPLLGLTGGTVGLSRGQPWQAHYRTEPFWPIGVLLADDVIVQVSPLVLERLLLPLQSASVFALLVADGNGDAVLQTTVPPLAVLQHRKAYVQAFSGFALPARTQPALGGVIR